MLVTLTLTQLILCTLYSTMLICVSYHHCVANSRTFLIFIIQWNYLMNISKLIVTFIALIINVYTQQLKAHARISSNWSSCAMQTLEDLQFKVGSDSSGNLRNCVDQILKESLVGSCTPAKCSGIVFFSSLDFDQAWQHPILCLLYSEQLDGARLL